MSGDWWANSLVLSHWRPSLCRAKNRFKGTSRREHYTGISKGSDRFNVKLQLLFNTFCTWVWYFLSSGIAVSTVVYWSNDPWARRNPKLALHQGCCTPFFRGETRFRPIEVEWTQMGMGLSLSMTGYQKKYSPWETDAFANYPDLLGFLVLKPGGLLPFLKSESSRYGPTDFLNKSFNALDSLEFSFEVRVCEQKW